MRKLSIILLTLAIGLGLTGCVAAEIPDNVKIDTTNQIDKPAQDENIGDAEVNGANDTNDANDVAATTPDINQKTEQENQDTEIGHSHEYQDSPDLGELDINSVKQGMVYETLEYNMNRMNSWNMYVQIMTSESDIDYDILTRVPSGESITYLRDGSTIIKDKDNQAIVFGEKEIYKTTGFDQIDMLYFAFDSIDKYGVMQTKDISTTDLGTAFQFSVDICGYDNIYKLYQNISDEVATETKNGFMDMAESNGYTVPMNLRFVYNINGKGIIQAGMYYYFSDEMIGVEDSDFEQCYCMWYFINYWKLNNWEFPISWYEYDFDTAINNGETESLMEIGQEVCDIANDKASEYYDNLNKSKNKEV